MSDIMYDPWGVGEALRLGMRMYSHTKRGTGRTNLLVSAVQNDDTIVFAQRIEEGEMIRRLQEAGKPDVRTITVDPVVGLGAALADISKRYNRRGQLFFDHGWMEACHYYQIERTMHDLGRFMDDMWKSQQSTRTPQELLKWT